MKKTNVSILSGLDMNENVSGCTYYRILKIIYMFNILLLLKFHLCISMSFHGTFLISK